MSSTSPRFPQTMGFVPLGQHGDNQPDADIPLTLIRSTASTTGARKPNQGIDDMGGGLGGEEKHGIFHRKSRTGRRRARKEEALARQGTAHSEVSLNFMGKLYTKIIGASVVTRYLVYIVPVALLLAVPLILLPITGHTNDIPLGAVFNDHQPPEKILDGPSLFRLFVWIEASWVSLWVGKVVAHVLPPIFMFFCGVVSSGTRKYATVLRALEIPLSLFFWALSSWLVFKVLFTDDRLAWVDVVKKILGALFASSAVFLGEKAIVQLISITYHQRSFANRIRDSKREVHLLGLMYDASRTLFPMYCPEFAEEDYIINDSIELMLGVKPGQNKSGSATPMRLIGNVGRFGDKVTSVFGNLASEITGKQVFNPNSAHSIVVEALEKVRSSEAMAKRIWMSFVVENKDALSLEDIEEVLGMAHKEEAEECFSAIDADSNGDISMDEMVRKVVEIGKERKAIANSMKDISQALAVFDRVLLFLVLLIVVFIFLAFFQSSFITTLATAGTALLSLSFVFAVTTQEFLGSCIFLFVKHPYDVGDRVDIVGSEKEQLIVEKISLLYTVFHRIDKMQVVQVPNIVLNNLWIENVTRSKAMKEVIDVTVSYDTTFEDIELLRLEMERFVRHPDNSRDFQPDLAFSVFGVGDLDRLQLKVAMKHKSNWHNDAVRGTRRSKFMCALALALKKVPIYGPGGGSETLGGPTNPSYSVAVSDAEAMAARDQVARDKEAKRMAPLATDPARNGSKSSKLGNQGVERRAAQDLNTRNAAVEAADGWGLNADSNTLNSREESLERKRSADIETVRQELMHTRESQRGRRQAGQGLSSPTAEDSPSMHVTRYASTRSNRNVGQSGTFDVESQTGGPAGFGTNPYGNMTTTIAGGAAAAQASGYSVFPPPSSSGNNFAGIQGGASPHPLQSAPANQNPSITVTGSRSRGASVSRPQMPPGQGSSSQRPF